MQYIYRKYIDLYQFISNLHERPFGINVSNTKLGIELMWSITQLKREKRR